MLGNLLKFTFHFMKTHDGLDWYNAILFSVPAYHDLTQKTMSYGEVSQSNRKEMKEMSRYLLGVGTQCLQGEGRAPRPILNCTIQCSRALREFYMYARYISYDDASLSYMVDAFCRFHTFNDVIFLERASRKE